MTKKSTRFFRRYPASTASSNTATAAPYWDSNFWLTKWLWSSEQGDEVIRAHRNLSLKAEGHMEIDSMFRDRKELPALALLGWYLIMILSDLRPG